MVNPIALSFFAVVPPNIPTWFVLPKLTCVVVGLLAYAFTREYKVNSRVVPLLFVYVLSTAFSIDQDISITGRYNDWSQGLWAAGIYALLTGFDCGTSWLKYSSAVLSVHALIQRMGYDSIFPSLENRAIATIGSPVDLGMILAMAFPISGRLMPLVGLGLWATGSRGALLAGGLSLLKGKYRLLALAALLGPFLSSRDSDIGRRLVWHAGALSAIEHPVLGSGPDTFAFQFRKHEDPAFKVAMHSGASTQNHAHNDILDLLSQTGILGLLSYLWLLPFLSHPSLFALFVNLKFNPASFEVLCAAALLIGTFPGKIKAKALGFAVLLFSIPYLTVLWLAETSPLPQMFIPTNQAYVVKALNNRVAHPIITEYLVQAHPLDSEAHYARAVSALQLGDRPRAKQEIMASLALAPYFKPALEIKKHLGL